MKEPGTRKGSRHSSMKRVYCEACYRISYDAHAEQMCSRCAGSARRVRRLYNKIVMERPHLNHLSQGQLFEKLYESYQKKEKRK